MSYRDVFVVIALIILMVTGSVGMYKDLQEAKYYQNKEFQCINYLIKKGIERKDIGTDKGICFVDENAYYRNVQ